MILIFRPWVRFVGQDKDTLSLLVHRLERYFKLGPATQFNYEIFVEGAAESSVPNEVLKLLKDNNLLESVEVANTPYLKPEISFLSAIFGNQSDLKKAAERISNAQCVVLDLALLGKENFKEIGTQVSLKYFSDIETYKKDMSSFSSSQVTVVVVDSYFEKNLNELNAFMIKEKKSWVLVNSNQNGIHLGPSFENNPTTYCFNCFQQRIVSWEEKNNQSFNRNMKFYNNLDIGKKAELSWLNVQIIRSFGTDFEVLKCFIQYFDIIDNQLAHLPFLPYPLCSVCKP